MLRISPTHIGILSAALFVGVQTDDLCMADAIQVKSAKLYNASNVLIKDLTPSGAGKFLIQDGDPSNPTKEGTVETGGVSAFQNATLAGSKSGYKLTLGTGQGANFAVGDGIRKKNGARKVIYQVLAVAGDVVDVWAPQGNFTIAAADTIEKVTGSQAEQGGKKQYGLNLPVSWTDIGGVNCRLEVEVDSAIVAAGDPVVTVAVDKKIVEEIAAVPGSVEIF